MALEFKGGRDEGTGRNEEGKGVLGGPKGTGTYYPFPQGRGQGKGSRNETKNPHPTNGEKPRLGLKRILKIKKSNRLWPPPPKKGGKNRRSSEIRDSGGKKGGGLGREGKEVGTYGRTDPDRIRTWN